MVRSGIGHDRTMCGSTRGCNPGTGHRVLFVLLMLALLSGSGNGATPVPANDAGAQRPVAEVLGKVVYEDDLVPAGLREEQKAKLAPDAYAAWFERARGENLRGAVWSAVFSDYAKKRNIEPTQAEIESHMHSIRKFQKEDSVRRERDHEGLIVELRSPDVTEARRKQARQYLDTLNSLREHDLRMEQERRDPAREQMWQDSERKVSEVWVRQWKVNQALFREFGGRIIFQQAGWEPIDAYRRLLDEYRARKAFVVHDQALREAVYGYFKHKFVYADEKKAKFYFERPYWERTPEEMKAAGF